MPSRTVLLAGLIAPVLLAALAACGSGDGELAAWDLPPAEASPAVRVEQAAQEAISEATPDGEGDEPVDTESSDVDQTLLDIDPCTLLDAKVFSAEVGSATKLLALEQGRACGITDEGDETRVALALVRSDGAPFLTADMRQRAEAVSGLGDGAEWVAGVPLPGSDLLVVAAASDIELVVEVSDRSGRSERERRELAVAVADAALDGIEGARP